MASTACITANPDIAGIGVRISIYVQTMLSFAPPLIFAMDGNVDWEEEESLHTIYINLLLTACSLLVSAFIQSSTFGLSTYHALIVLNLSWMINASALTVCIFPTITRHKEHESWLMWAWRQRPTRPKRLLGLFLVLLHLCAMASLGIWVWAMKGIFGHVGNTENESTAVCNPQVFTTIFGHDIYVTNQPLRILFLTLYSIIAIPGLNAAFLTGVMVVCCATLAIITAKIIHKNTSPPTPRSLYISAVIIQAFISASLIADTELMIHRSRHLVFSGESDWTFGQTLALLIVIFPFAGVAKRVVQNTEQGERASIRMKWWFRRLLRESTDEWIKLRDEAIEKMGVAQHEVCNWREVAASGHLPGSVAAALTSADAALQSAFAAVEAANITFLSPASAYKASTHDPESPSPKPDPNCGIDKKQSSLSQQSTAESTGMDKKWADFCTKADHDISEAREKIVTAYYIRLREVKDIYCFATAKASLGVANAALGVAQASISAARVAYNKKKYVVDSPKVDKGQDRSLPSTNDDNASEKQGHTSNEPNKAAVD